MPLLGGIFKVIQCIDIIRAYRFSRRGSMKNNFILEIFSEDKYR